MKEVVIENGRIRVRTINNEPSLTQQQFKEQCDVNNIMKKYRATGQVTHLARRQGMYADLSRITDYHSMVNQIVEAQNAFGTLPAELRLRFNNDPGKLLEFMQDPSNFEEGVRLGIYEPKKAENARQSVNDDSTTITKNARKPQKMADTKTASKELDSAEAE